MAGLIRPDRGNEEGRKMRTGLASLLANNSMEYDEEQIKKMLENVFFGMAAARKGK